MEGLRRAGEACGLVMCFVALGWTATALDIDARLMLVLATTVVLVAPLALRAWHRTFDVFEPIVAFVAAYGVIFLIRPVAILARGDLTYRRPNAAVDISDTFTGVLVLGFLGACAFVAGYESGIGRALANRWRVPQRQIDERIAVVTCIAVAACGALTFVAFVVLAGGRAFLGELLSGRSLSLQDTVAQGSGYLWTAWQIVIPAAIVLLAIGARARDRRLIAVALGIAGLSLVRQIPLGARVTLLPMVGGGLIILYLLRDRRPRAISVAVSACVALVVSATLLAARTPEDRRNRSFGAIVVDNVRAPGQVLRPLTTGGDAEMAPALVAALTVVPKETGYRYGFAIVGDLFSRPIPRSVWPGRPAPLGKP